MPRENHSLVCSRPRVAHASCSGAAWLLPAVLLVASLLRAGVTYDDATDTLIVDNYPEQVPCTPHTLSRIDTFNGWGKVSADGASQTVAVHCNLQIGLNTGTDTHFQIGDPTRPRETLVVHGNVVIHPFHVHGLNQWSGPRRVIRLTLGERQNPQVTPVLKIASEAASPRGLYINRVPLPDGTLRFADRWTTGGQLHVYHGTITAAVQDRQHAFGGETSAGPHVLMYGDSVVLQDATVSWFKGVATFGLNSSTATVENTVFEHGATAMINKGWLARGCTFRKLGTAIQDWGGALDARLVDCRFEGNVRNLRMRFRGSRVIAVDCIFGVPDQPDCFASVYERKGEGPTPPMLVSERHLLVRVLDEQRQPVPGAKVGITCENVAAGDVLCITSWSGATGPAGITPGRGDDGAALLTESRTSVGATPTEPDVLTFSYRVRAQTPTGAVAVLDGLQLRESWETVDLLLPDK